ncbi:hypothetical protein [Ralstonia chuxiongensis]|uniref:Uncharacterized protein n=1 Tax=Ralstonia chuxiongensis TaxID=2957504 RepID=A0AA41WUX2_9RALS|nr:hypothetical protein [Ralstonia chuxiongensis]MCP1175638.1 hypothetical protein [Ralstonia chuxiongensis]
MIAFKDFQKAPKLGGLLSGSLETAVAAANEWINASAVQVINIETIFRAGSIAGVTSTSQDGVRVWYIE